MNSADSRDSTSSVLRLYFASPELTLPRLLHPAPHINPGFQEHQTAYIGKPSGASWSFRIDDEPLPNAPAPFTAWAWKPGFYAGEVTGELVSADGTVASTYLLDVSPDPRKLGREFFSEMVQEIWDDRPDLVIGVEPARSRIGELGGTENPLISFSRLRQHGPPLVLALRAIARHPLWTVRFRREQVPLHRVRKADRLTALAALRDPTSLAVLAASPADDRARWATSQGQLDVPVAEQHFDGAANRCLVAFAHTVLHRIRSVTDALERLVSADQPSDTRTALTPRWPVRRDFLARLHDEITRILRGEPFSRVTRPEITAAGLNATAADPFYARAQGLAWRILRLGLSGPPIDERLWISPTWEIYERWCFIRLARMLRSAYPHLTWGPADRHPTRAIAAWRGSSGQDSVELLLQPVFSSWDQSGGRWRSLSSQRLPDLVIICESPERTRFIVLDAKYRVDRGSVLEGMGSAHLYHDALRFGGRLPDLSLLLIPGPSGAEWLEDASFHAEHRVGAAVLGPHQTTLSPDFFGYLVPRRSS